MQIDGSDTIGVVSVGESVMATIAGVTIDGGASANGGGIADAGNLMVIDTTISDCSAIGYNGGSYGTVGGQAGIYDGGELTVNDCTFSNDQTPDTGGDYSPGEGGGIYIQAVATASVTNSTFQNDQASLGGGIFNYAGDNYGTYVFGTLTVTGGAITQCAGGGIYNAGNATISQCSLAGNFAASTNYGGTPYCGGIVNDGTATISLCTIESNTAEYGSGISNQSGTMTIDSTTIAKNGGSGASYGGGIYNNGSLTVTGSTIAENSILPGMGGGIYDANEQVYGGQSSLFLYNSTIANNVASQGGGVFVAGASMEAVNCTIAYNISINPGAGGGLDIAANSIPSSLTRSLL